MVLRFQSPFSLFVYIFKRLLDLDQKSAEYEFSRVSLHSVCQSATVELFSIGLIWKFSKSFCFHRNRCKMQIIYGNVVRSFYTFFNQIHLFILAYSFVSFHVFLSKIDVCDVQKRMSKHIFRTSSPRTTTAHLTASK